MELSSFIATTSDFPLEGRDQTMKQSPIVAPHMIKWIIAYTLPEAKLDIANQERF